MPPNRYWSTDAIGRKIRRPGVTTIIDQQLAWNKRALIRWAHGVGFDGKELYEGSADALGIGTVVHALIEADVEELPVPDFAELSDSMRSQVQRAMDAWEAWKRGCDFQVLAAEESLVDDELEFGGTVDLIMVADGKVSLMDYKTSKALYPNALVQVAAYGHLWNLHHPGERIEEYRLLRLSKLTGLPEQGIWPAGDLEPCWQQFKQCLESKKTEHYCRMLLADSTTTGR